MNPELGPYNIRYLLCKSLFTKEVPIMRRNPVYLLSAHKTVPRLRRWNRRETFALPFAVSLASHREKT